MKRLAALAALAVAAAACETSAPTLPDGAIGSEISSGVVISQVYGGGGNAGATYTHDFVELYNKGNAPVSLAGWSIQYAGGTSSTWAAGNMTVLTSGTIAPGGYFLVSEASNAAVGAALPVADVVDNTTMAAAAGKVALVSNQTLLTGACPTGGAIVDFIGYGTGASGANCAEGIRTGTLSATAAAIRKKLGCTESDQNSLDFSIETPAPRNSLSTAHSCLPSGAGAGNPNPVGQGGTTRLTVSVTPGSAPASTGLAVVANLSAILGSSAQLLFDDATNGDVVAGDNVFSLETTVSDAVTTGPKTIDFDITDAQARLDSSGSFVLNVVANAAPVAENDNFGVLLNQARSLDVLANDTDADGDVFDVTEIVILPSRGTAVIETDGSITYTPNNGELGGDLFSYAIVDEKGESDTGDVAVTIRSIFAENDSYGATEEQALVVTAPGVLTNDSNSGVCGGYIGGDYSCITASVVTGPAQGSLTLSSDGSFTYTPFTNFFGIDSFTYKAYSSGNLSNAATVLINVANVNDGPVAVADAFSVTEDVTLTRNAAQGVLANDTDPDLETLHAVLDASPAHGLLTLNDDGSLVYVPDLDYNATDSFTYHVTDAAAVASGAVTVMLNYTAVNDAPLAFADAYPLDEDTPIMILAAAGLVTNDTDVDSVALSAVVVDPPDHGTFANMAAGAFTYTPNANYHGLDTMTYRASDGTATSATAATVTFTIASVNDAPTAVNDAYATDEDTPLSAAAPGLLGNDGDVDGDAITPVVDAQPAGGSVTVATDGSFVYTPSANFEGDDTFTYHVTDGTESSSIVSVALTVDAVNDAPSIPAPLSPTGGETVDASDLVFTWSPSTDADGDSVTYRLELLRDGTLYAQSQTAALSATIPGNLGKGAYTWRVMATDGSDNSGFSGEQAFTLTKGGGGGGGGLFGCSTSARAGSPLPALAMLLGLSAVIRARRLRTLP